MSNKEIKLLKTILMYRIGVYLPIFFVVVTMNCKRQVNRKLGSRSTNSLLPFAVNVILASAILVPRSVLAILQFWVESYQSYHGTVWGTIFVPFSYTISYNLVQCNLWDTSIQAGTPPFRGHKIWSWQNLHIIFVFVTSFERTPLFRGKGHFFWAPKPQGLTFIHGSP